jgi:uncharacterized membrane protein
LASLSQARTLGGVGSILIILSIIPYAGTALGIVGWILTIIAVKYVSDVLQDRTIFNNALISIILAIVGVAIGGIVVAGAVFGFLGLHNVTFPTNSTTTTVPSNVVGLIAGVIAGLAVLWILAIISAFFLRRSYDSVAKRLNIGMFRTGALLYFIGAILTIIFVGFILIFVAEILFAIAFFSIPESLAPPAGPSPPPPVTGAPTTGASAATGTTKFCANCGATLDRSASFCPNCGASQPATT